jgi:glycosyltransferase involved in cell wall biosynthesis
MRILIVNYEYPPVGGGAAVSAEAIARELTRLGHSVFVLTSRFKKLPKCEENEGITIHRVPSFRRAMDRSGIFEMASFLISGLLFAPSIIRTRRIEVTIIFFSFPCGPIGLLARWMCGIPYVVLLRGGDVPGTEPSLNFIHRVLAPIRRAVLKNSIAIVANSEGLRRMAEAADPFSVRVIPNGVDVDLFVPAQSSPTRKVDVFSILFVGRLQKQKNLPELLKQAAQLPANAFELHLLGDGPEKKHLEDLAAQLGIASAVTWHGWVPRKALPAFYQSANCLVIPSFYEGMPNVVLEAMASGLPVVASNVPGNADLVVNGETGFLFALEEPNALLVALKTLMASDQLCRQFGSVARRRAMSGFSWRTVAEKYLQLFSR